MKQTLITLLLLVLACSSGHAQSRHEIDSLRYTLLSARNDTDRVLALVDLCSYYDDVSRDSSIIYGQQGLDLARRIKFLRGEASLLAVMGFEYRILGDIPKALEYAFRGAQIARDNHYAGELSSCLSCLWYAYWELNDYPEAIKYIKEAIAVQEQRHDNPGNLSNLMNNLAATYTESMQLDSALEYIQHSFLIVKKMHLPDNPWMFLTMGNLQARLGKYTNALAYWQSALNLRYLNHRLAAYAFASIAGYFQNAGAVDSCIYYAEKGLRESQAINFNQGVLDASGLLAQVYENRDIGKALSYLKIKELANDQLYGEKKVKLLEKILSEEQKRQRKADAQKTVYENRVKQYGLLAGLAVFLFTAFLLYINNRRQRSANAVLKLQKEEIQSTLNLLKTTQAQLIQSEKLASLGELTAGIAHEIQNPLNFVNNFSEVNQEMLVELHEELNMGNISEAKVIATDIQQNEEKINHHGKRADAIVKGMLQHSRINTGQKEPTDISALANEYLRLSYHGLRAKDKNFNAEMHTSFDESVGKVNIVPQEVGRVLLNLYNNAFYAVNEKAKTVGRDYTPTVTVTTRKEGGNVLITVADNGNGIPQKIIDKIFQPFFTTKPTGQGTGLGLSLSYDIIKAHSGQLSVESKWGEGAEFIIILPTGSKK